MIRLSELLDATVRTLDGEVLGHVHEVHCDDGRVTAFMCGPGSFIERMTAKAKGRRIPWECVKRLEPGRITVVADPPQRIVKPSGSRTRRRTPQTSARRSKR